MTTKTAPGVGDPLLIPAPGVPSQRSGVPLQPGLPRTPDRCIVDECIARHVAHRCGRPCSGLRAHQVMAEAARDRAVIAAGGLLAAGLYPKEET